MIYIIEMSKEDTKPWVWSRDTEDEAMTEFECRYYSKKFPDDAHFLEDYVDFLSTDFERILVYRDCYAEEALDDDAVWNFENGDIARDLLRSEISEVSENQALHGCGD